MLVTLLGRFRADVKEIRDYGDKHVS